MNYTLQNILFPNLDVCCEQELYYRSKNAILLKDRIILNRGCNCQFDTYFNSFSIGKWRKYSKINNLSLNLKLKGKFVIEVFSANWLMNQGVIKECIYNDVLDCTFDNEKSLELVISKNENIYFQITSLVDDGEFYGGYYSTNTIEEQINNVEIDLVMCTFKREAFVKRNLELLTNDFFASEKYNGAKHFNVKIVDNGQTLLESEIVTADGKVKLYHNINTGGSGGFCRGMMESLNEGNATHILFMDDDVLVQIEAFERTYNLLSLLKEEHCNAFLGGAMFRLDNQKIQLENIAAYKGTSQGLVSLKHALDMSLHKNCVFNEVEENVKGCYQGWWYCCIPAKIANLNNLPYPFFIRMDDMEYSLRNVKNIVTLNGINVWHEAFDRKYSTMMENYFMFRNKIVVNMVHNVIGLKAELKDLLKRFMREIVRYDYNGAELLLDGVERVLEGPEFYKKVDTVEDLKVHASKQLKQQKISEINDVDINVNHIRFAWSQIGESKLQKYFRFITLNGHLLPDFMFKNFGYAEYGYTSNSRLYYRHKKILALDKNLENAVFVQIDRSRMFNLLMRYITLNIKFILNYSSLKRDYKKDFKEMVSEPFWRKYLKLE